MILKNLLLLRFYEGSRGSWDFLTPPHWLCVRVGVCVRVCRYMYVSASFICVSVHVCGMCLSASTCVERTCVRVCVCVCVIVVL